MSQLRAVIRAQGSELRPIHFAAGIGSAIAFTAFGFYFAEAWMEPPSEVATVKLRKDLPSGQIAIEVAFWLSMLLSNFLAFRALELFLRAKVVRMFRDLPIEPGAVFGARLLTLLKETLLLAGIGACAFIPIGIAQPVVGLSAAGTLLLGAFTSSFVALGSILYVGTVFGRASGGDSYGGVGAAFMYGPTLGFAASAATNLVAKLAFGELLQQGQPSNAFWFATGIGVVAAAFALRTAHVHFRNGYHEMAAAFEEADNTMFDLGTEYQTSAYPGKSETYKRLGSFARVVQLQYKRRHPVARLFEQAWLVGSILFIYFKASAIPSAGVLIAFLVPYGLLANPWDRAIRLPGDRYLPPSGFVVSPTVVFQFALHFVLTLIGVVAALYFSGNATTETALLAASAISCVAATTVWLARRPLLSRWVPRFFAAAIVVSAFVSPVFAVGLSVIALVAGLVVPKSNWVIT